MKKTERHKRKKRKRVAKTFCRPQQNDQPRKPVTYIAQRSLNKWSMKVCWLFMTNKLSQAEGRVWAYFNRHCFDPNQILAIFELSATILQESVDAGFDSFAFDGGGMDKIALVKRFHIATEMLEKMKLEFCKKSGLVDEEGKPKNLNILETIEANDSLLPV
jgi:hypothetical protein